MKTLEVDYGLHEVTSWPIEPLHMHCAILELPANADRTAVLANLSQDSRVRLAQPLQTFATRTEAYNDPYVGLQRGFERIDVADAHPLSRGKGIKVAIIDTGVDTEHPDLRGVVVKAVNFVDADNDKFRRDRHGTEVAGVIAAVANNREGIVGIAPDARLLVFKSCWQMQPDKDAARCNSFTLAQGLVAALDAHAQVVNLSLAGPDDPLLHNLIQEGLRRGILFVGAAPNGAGSQGDQLTQQAGVIEVDSAESQPLADARLYAPGREILTLLPGGHYDFATGSSLATAHVTGTVALMLARNPGLSSAAAYQLLRDTSGHRASDSSTNASIDACAALVAVIGRGGCRAVEPPQSRVANGNDHS
jgi:subtilisin family serine protease